ncbi:MAG: DUF4058 family protein [Candidatus Tectomicrobia bacterium]|uniref:DUF4058 family protein n=1 Tax=Tectimicrobiota bacterium TaxID=2528274 RepID=A0A937VWM8_UNCTE|nr:DUF4058 family protein [Candidatus Tectomicrobia bacterium]
MPSPFPGMDPFIESRRIWTDFHLDLAAEMRAYLNTRVQPGYYATAVDWQCINVLHNEERLPMSECTHLQLMLLAEQQHDRVRCRHCHLTIKAADLPSRYCPECWEATGRKQYDFEPVVSARTDVVRYRCEMCGVIIEAH